MTAIDAVSPARDRERSKAAYRARRERLLASGTCVACGHLRANHGQLCGPCSAANTRRNAKRRAIAKATGGCVRCVCHKASRNGHCEICLQWLAGRHQREQERLAARLCVICGAPAATRWFCRAHADQANANKARLKRERAAAGLCWNCGKTSRPGMLNCKPCAVKLAGWAVRRRKQRRTDHLCADCGAPIPPGRFIRCGTCREKHSNYSSEIRRRAPK